jgi:hypothetical protein
MRAAQAWTLLRQMGPRWVAFRSAYALRRRLGGLERQFPAGDWSDYRWTEGARAASDLHARLVGEGKAPFFFRPGDLELRRKLAEVLEPSGRAAVVAEAEALREGRFRFFSCTSMEVGFPPDWHRHPVSGARWPRVHWSLIDDGDPTDVKWLWELGRFGFAYALARAFWLTGDDRHAAAFWTLAESWKEHNPPNCGVHWACGQECAVRSLAWCFALFAFLDSPTSTPERVAMLIEMLAAHGERIHSNLPFALAQRNNHGINEALALWTLGTLFPFLPRAEEWEGEGRRHLEQEGRRQIGDDGAYVQHSLNYHRLTLQSYAWALRLGDLHHRPFSEVLRGRYAAAAELLEQLTDEGSGGAPNYGSNDGSLLFRLDTLPFGDQRSALALADWIAGQRRHLDAGPWDEALLWFCGEEPLRASVQKRPREDFAAPEGGYYTLRAGNTWAMVRCCAYRTRPAQADLLHLDVWWKGINLAADPGTYSYSAPAPWTNGLRHTGVHNTIEVDGQDQMEAGSRFTWFGWTQGRLSRRDTQTPALKLLEGEHDGYLGRLGIRHRRAVMLVGGLLWVVVDDLGGTGVHQLRSQWLFPGSLQESLEAATLRLSSPAGPCAIAFHTFTGDGERHAPRVEAVVPSPDSRAGWFSPHYGSRSPSLAVIVTDTARLPARRLTLLSLDSTVRVTGLSDTRMTADLAGSIVEVEWSGLQAATPSTVASAALRTSEGEVFRLR